MSLCDWSNENWWWFDLSMLINSHDEKGVIKEGTMVIGNDLKAYYLIVDVVSQMHCFELCIIMKMVISLLFMGNMSFVLALKHGFDNCYM